MGARRASERLLLAGTVALLVALVLPFAASTLAGDAGGTAAMVLDFFLVPIAVLLIVAGGLGTVFARARAEGGIDGPPPISDEELRRLWAVLHAPDERARLGDVPWAERRARLRALAAERGLELEE